jgi:hypothetical protein
LPYGTGSLKARIPASSAIFGMLYSKYGLILYDFVNDKTLMLNAPVNE